MSQKTKITLMAFLGTTIGSYIPVIWGGSELSFTSLLLGGVGGILGIVLAIKFFGD